MMKNENKVEHLVKVNDLTNQYNKYQMVIITDIYNKYIKKNRENTDITTFKKSILKHNRKDNP
jgi:hypothetical protein